MLAGSDATPPVPSPAATATPEATDSPKVAAPPRDEKPRLHYDVTFLETPGLSFHALGVDPDFPLDPPADLAFLSDLEVNLLLRHIVDQPDVSLSKAPKVSTFPDKQAVIVDSGNRRFTEVRSPAAPDDRQKEIADGQPHDEAEYAEGTTMHIRGHLSDDKKYISLDIQIENIHIIEIHTSEIPGRDGDRIEVPEIVRTDLDRDVTVPSVGGNVLLNLGLARSVDADGTSSIAERLVLIRPRVVIPEPAAAP